jgi:hypothetical protein
MELSQLERSVMADVAGAWLHQRRCGFNISHDMAHRDGELSCAAAAYATELISVPATIPEGSASTGGELWPWHIDEYKPRSRRENLLRATAFLLSEIVRLDVEAMEAAGKCRKCGSRAGQNCQCSEW